MGTNSDLRRPSRTHNAQAPRKERAGELNTELLAPNVMLLATSMRRSGALAYRRALSLERNEWSVIAVIGECRELSLGTLAEHIGVDKGQLSREVSALVSRGLIVKIKKSRTVSIRLSTRGQDVFRKLLRVRQDRNRRLLRGLRGEQRSRLFQLLKLVKDNAAEELRRELSMN